MEPASRVSALVAVVPPPLAARALRVCRERIAACRGEERLRGGPTRSVILIEILPAGARTLRADPLLSTAWIGATDESLAGPAGRESVAITALGSGRTRVFRLRERLDGEARPLAGHAGRELEPGALAVSGPPRPVKLAHAARRAKAGSGAESAPAAHAFWVPSAIFPRFLDLLGSLPAGAWRSLRVRCGTDGAVITGAVSARALRESGLALAVPLESRPVAGDQILHAEIGIEVPALVAGLAPPASPVLLHVEDGAVRAEALEAADVAALELVTHGSRRLAFEPPPPAAEATAARDDPRSTAALLIVVRTLRPRETGDVELRKAIESAFLQPELRPGAAGPRAPRGRARWLRHFIPRRLSESWRRILDQASRRRLADPAARRKVIGRQRDALALLLRKLSGPDWRSALPAAPPLRRPGPDGPASPWLHAGAETGSVPLDFSLDLLRESASYGVFGAGERVYRALEILYRQAAERFLAAGEHRRAAHVFSYLLGDHARAAAALEAGGFLLEAATLHYHLARDPASAAQCLERAGLHEEASRIWMDLGRWQAAALSWQRAGNPAQAAAAWRMEASRLKSKGELIGAAEVLDRELGERAAALVLLEHAVFALGPHCLLALTLALKKREKAGEVRAARDLHERALAAFAGTAARAPRRPALRRLAEWAERAYLLVRKGSAAIDRRALRCAWLAAARAWARARDASPSALRSELDQLLASVARRCAVAAGDPWLAPDVEVWLKAPASHPPGASATAVTENVLPARCSTLALGDDEVIAGTEDGRLFFLDLLGRVTREIDTRAARPVGAVVVLGSDLYCAVAERVYHFSLDRPAGGRSPPAIPLQVERSLQEEVLDLLLFPSGRLLRVSRSEARWLHPQHLQPLGILHQAPVHTEIRSACANRRFTALLVARHPEEPVGGLTFAGLCFDRSQTRPEGSPPSEVFPIRVREPRRLMFTDLAADDLIASGEEEGVFLRSRREFAVPFALEASSRARRLPHARARVLRLPDDLLIAYGDGSLERVSLAEDSRSFLAPAPEGELDPLVGFELAGRPREAWLLHGSGRLRRVALPAAAGP